MSTSNNESKEEGAKKRRGRPVTAAQFEDGTRIEMLFDRVADATSFIVWKNDNCNVTPDFKRSTGETLVPYAASNNLIKHGVVLLPSGPVEYSSDADLLDEIRSFIHRYVDVSESFERIAAYYVFFSWVYDAFNEVPYLRVRGDYGSGKTRFLLIVGSLCYKPIFASGASTVSPLFHTLNAFRGTLIMDEGDFRFSDEKADIIKMLNNGTVAGLPVLRTEMTREREFNPRAFEVFGPKIVATRGSYDDRALESRFITEEMGQTKLRADVPINLPSAYHDEALALRNKLLLFRLRTVDRVAANDAMVDPMIEPRLNQMFVPLLSIIEDADVRKDLRDLARQYHRRSVVNRGQEIEGQVVQVIRSLFAGADRPYITIREITETFTEHFGRDYERQITNKWIGSIIRRKLSLCTEKSHGVYVLPITERPKLEVLYEHYGIDQDNIADSDNAVSADQLEEIVAVEDGDDGDVVRARTIEF